MSEIEIKGEQFYSILLDSLDLFYLGKYLHTPRAEKMPLWTKKKLNGESEYCQVQIVRAHDNEECYSEKTIEMTDCHICSVEVPITCYKEHTESERHVTLENIFQNILERLSKQIKTTIIHNDNSIDKDLLYHCVSCSKIIKIENKQKHDMSPYHVKSQKELSIVQEFYKMFKNENLVNSNDFEEVNEVIVDEERESEKIISTEHLQINTIRNCVSESVQDMHSNDGTNTVCSSNDHTIKLTLDDNLVSSSFEEYYFKQIIRKHELKVDLPIIDGDFIHITNSRGIKVKIFKDIFHSFTSRSQHVYCQLCDSLFTPKEKNEHKVTGRHSRNIFIKVNEHFARMFCNNFWSHCLICNEVYQTSYLSKHCLVDENHIRTLKSSKISDVCQNNVDTNTPTVNNTELTRSGIRESGERSIVEYKEQTKPEKPTNEKDLNKSKENKLKYSDDKEYIGAINKSEDRPADYMRDKNHIEKTKEVSPVQKTVLCELCNATVLQDQIEYHNAGTTHWSNALKKIFTSVVLGVQAYLSEDETKLNDKAKGDENPSKSNIAINKEHSITVVQNTIADENVFCNKNAIPVDENNVTKDENAISKDESKDENTITKDKNAITEGENAITKDKNAITEDENAITKDENTITKDKNAITEDENAITKDKKGITEYENIKTEDKNTTTSDENAVNKDENAITKDGNTITKDKNAITEDENAITEDENAITKDKNAITEDENIKTEDKNTTTSDENAINKDENAVTEDENTTLKHNVITNENAITEDENFTSTSISNGDIAPPNPFRFADATKKKVTCMVCDIDIENTQQSIYAHGKSLKHKSTVRDLLSFHYLKICYKCFDSNNGNELNAEVFFCESCNIIVTDIWVHIKTEKHITLRQLNFRTSAENLKFFVYKCKDRRSKACMYRQYYKQLLETNKVNKLRMSHYCSLCKLELVQEGSEIDHMLSVEHKKKLAMFFKYFVSVHSEGWGINVYHSLFFP